MFAKSFEDHDTNFPTLIQLQARGNIFFIQEVNHSYQVQVSNYYGQCSAVWSPLYAHNECPLLFVMTILYKFDSEYCGGREPTQQNGWKG